MSLVNFVKFALVLVCSNCYYHICFASSKNFSQPHVRTGGWTPIPTKHSKLLSESVVSHIASASSSVSSQKQRIDMLPIPVIKPHAHGATLGFDLPEQGLTLYLDIDELATKPLAQNIGLKVVSHDRHQSPSFIQPAPAPAPNGKHQNFGNNKPGQFSKNTQSNSNARVKPTPVPHIPKRQKSRFFGSYDGNAPPSSPSSKVQSSSSPKVPSSNKYHIGYIRPTDLHKALKHVGLNHGNIDKQQQGGNSNNGNVNNEQIIANFLPLGKANNFPQQNTMKYQTNGYSPPSEFRPPSSKGGAPPPKPAPKVPKPKIPKFPGTGPKPMQKPEEEDEDNEVAIITTTPTTRFEQEDEKDVQQNVDDDDFDEPNEKSQIPEPQKQVNKEESDNNEEVTDDDGDKSNAIVPSALPTPTTNAHFVPPEDKTIVRPFPSSKDTQMGSCSMIQSCQMCAPNTQKIITESTLNIKDIAKDLDADAILNTFPSLEDQMQSILDSGSYTLFLPSSNAFSQLPSNLIDSWSDNQESLNTFLDNHVLETAQTLEDMRLADIIQPRSAGATIKYNNNTNTVNGQRIMIGDQKGPNDGMIHVVDGILFPTADKDIVDTLKTCNRFDGFITLAEGTGFSDTLKQNGPFTVFVPSNEALQKVPDSDLAIIKNNMTALREFLKYHVAVGSYYSNDLKDGQFIPSMVDNQPIQVGIRVDGCSRRLVEANVSPLYRADIPASNGVIHVVDWVLKPNDRDWCDGVILPR